MVRCSIAELVERAADPRPLWQIDEDGSHQDPVWVVELDGVAEVDWSAESGARVLALLDAPTPVLLGVSEGTVPVAAAPLVERFTCTLAAGGPGRTWVSGGGQDVLAVAESVRRAPHAATTLASLLRVTSALPVPDALVAESLAYSTLLSGPEHLAWRATRPRRAAPAAEDAVTVRRHGTVLHVELNRPERHNAFGRAVRDALVDALELAASDPSFERVLLTGRGPSFSSGGDLDEFGTYDDPVTAHLVRIGRSAGLALDRVAGLVEVRLHGAVIGAGLEISAFASRVVAEDGTWICLPELSMGLVPGAGGTVSVPRRIGRWRTAWLAITGENLDVATALDWGLVDDRA